MYFVCLLSSSLLALLSLVSAAPADTNCTNSPTTRSCWQDGFDVTVNTDDRFPDTGKTVKVLLTATEQILSPDGVARQMQVFNGQYPGPTITADWGDTIEVTVQNNLSINGTSVHWHGLRQFHSNQMDGVNGLTECPIPPGGSRTYLFKATTYGTTWYHSHYSAQYGDGLVGSIVINGPSTANYDIDLGPIEITDWFTTPMFELLAAHPTAPPTSQTILVNGKAGSTLSKFTFTPGKKHLLRFVNTGINNMFHVGIDGHDMTIVANDLVPVKPYATKSITIAVGGGKCDGPNAQASANNTKAAIVQYTGAPDGTPSSTPIDLPLGCEDLTGLVPSFDTTIPAPGSFIDMTVTLDTSAGVFWKVNGLSQDINWNIPTLDYVVNGTFDLPANDNGIVIQKEGWVYLRIVNESPLPHPMHLHGHDFWILSTGTGDATNASLTLQGAVRRDTHTVVGNNGKPGTGGYAILAFRADNPGSWLFHCHIPFHISGGLGVQFLERPSEIIGSLGDLSVYTDGCAAWNTFQSTGKALAQPDSGLKRRSRISRFF